MQPRQMRDPFSPVEPRLTYSIAHQARTEMPPVKPRPPGASVRLRRGNAGPSKCLNIGLWSLQSPPDAGNQPKPSICILLSQLIFPPPPTAAADRKSVV